MHTIRTTTWKYETVPLGVLPCLSKKMGVYLLISYGFCRCACRDLENIVAVKIYSHLLRKRNKRLWILYAARSHMF